MAAGSSEELSYVWEENVFPDDPPPVPTYRFARPRHRHNFTREDTEEMIVSSKHAGIIIGRNGSTVRKIQDDTRAYITVLRDLGNVVATVEIAGREEARRKARERIEKLTQPPKLETCFVKKEPDMEEKVRPLTNWAELLAKSDEAERTRWAHLPPVRKYFYTEDPNVARMTAEDVQKLRADYDIVVNYLGAQACPPITTKPVESFEQAFSKHPEILGEIYKNKFLKPTPIQRQAWPLLLQGQDLIGIAQTGTGKTLAFLLPALVHVDNQDLPREKRKGPSCLILAPTRELAQQIERETKKYNYRGIKSVCIYGGGNRREQIAAVKQGVEIVIATPGRLNDLAMNKYIDLKYVTFLVMDEADRMLDMGFELEIKKIMLDIRPDRQTVMTSATWPEDVHRLSEKYTSNPFQVFIGSLDLHAVHTVTQTIILCEEIEKRQHLFTFLGSMQPQDKVIIFLSTKAMVDRLTGELVLSGIDCDSIHGDREQGDRERALDDLASGKVQVLIATDVAARGLDIKDVTHIFNFDFPRNIEDYVHRVGRTGRAGRFGEAVTLVTRENWMHAPELILILEEANQAVPKALYEMADRYKNSRSRRQNCQQSKKKE
nr:probable ATP-dependent RNA helicase DDX43 [Dermacentor andersoni]